MNEFTPSLFQTPPLSLVKSSSQIKSLSQTKPGEKAKIKEIQTQSHIFHRLMDMGLTLNSSIQVLVKLPFGGNFIILSDYGKYSIQKEIAQQIKVKTI